MLKEKHYSVSGIVQGVGFRPLCVRIAHRCSIKGSVANTSDGVMLCLQGEESSIQNYLDELRRECPDVALIIEITLLDEKTIDVPDKDFIILKSVRSERQRVLLPPDMATCADCLADIRDPGNRRFRYPFTNCTNCGPRFSIVKTLPYDRPGTTMSIFPMCPDCTHEYRDETNRRFHAQPNACPECGPHLTFTDGDGAELASGEKALSLTVDWLRQGRILAIKGLGGFHLVCDARNETAVALLRKRKRRPSRPFALMVKDLDEAELYVSMFEEDKHLLSGSRAPIVLLQMKDSSLLAPSIAPGLDKLGIMLPYTPLHHLLLEQISPLVMTSANISGSPLVSDNDEALQKLAAICDGFLMHNRPIHMKIDDSVLLSRREDPVIVRRARGYVPNPVITSKELAPVVAAGAEMKGTFAFSQDNMIFPSQYLGDMKELGTAQFYSQAVEHFKRLYNFAPRALAHDLHPLFISTAQAKKAFPDLQTIGVQHHYAHMMACLAENRAECNAVGLILDGVGYGEDGTIWGGEILAGGTQGFERAAHLRAFRLPGGDIAVKEIWRCGFSLLVETCGADEALRLCSSLWPQETAKASQLLKVWNSFPLCTSCGRLFDGTASIIMKKSRVTYDGEGAMELEALARKSTSASGDLFSVSETELDWRPFVLDLCQDMTAAPEKHALAFHANLAEALAASAVMNASRFGLETVALSGGCWQNSLLLDESLPRLRKSGLRVLTHSLLSPNDECVSVGQAYVAGMRLAAQAK